MKNSYRIKQSAYGGWNVHIRYWFCPLWVDTGEWANNAEDAKTKAHKHALPETFTPVTINLGKLP